MKRIRVGVICDFREEGWLSMDLIADMLLEMLPVVSPDTIAATRLQPAMRTRFGRLPFLGGHARAELADRLTGRFYDYPRWLKPRLKDFDVFHIVDHSYAHLVQALPAGRTIVTCNDVDAILPVSPGRRRGFDASRGLARRIIDGLGQAERVACISHATEQDLLAFGRIIPERVVVAYLGVHPSCSPVPDPRWDAAANRRLGPARVELLHVGSTIPRKRIEMLLQIFRGVLDRRPDVRLLRVGDPLTASQAALAGRLGVADAIVQLPFLERPELAAVYRRAALVLLPSDREGFGLPVVEAMACGTPVLASAIPSLIEAGGAVAAHCDPADLACWVTNTLELLTERNAEPAAWEQRRQRGLAVAARFSWREYAAEMTRLYQAVYAFVKVLHLGKFYPPARGGMETILELICARTSAEVENTVLVANHSFSLSHERHGPVEVIRLPAAAKIGAVAVLPTLPFRLRRARADLIVIHEPNPMALLAYFLARPAGKLIVWFHSEVVRPSWRYTLFYRPFLRFAFERASRIIVASPTLAASAPQLRGWQSKCVVIPYGLEMATGDAPARVAARADAIRRDAAGQRIVLFVGRLVKYKGVDVLLEAMRGVSATAVLVGNGPERAALQRTAERAGVADRVTFLGEAAPDELAALYRACDLFVLPSVSRQEAFGVVQIEAMACGKPIISTGLGTGTGWVNQDGETGFVVPPRDAAALHDAMVRLLADDTLLKTMGAASRHRARALFGVDRMVASVLALFREVVGGGRAAA